MGSNANMDRMMGLVWICEAIDGFSWLDLNGSLTVGVGVIINKALLTRMA